MSRYSWPEYEEFLSRQRIFKSQQSWVCEGHARMTDQAKYARQIRLGAHDWRTKRVTEAPCRAQQRCPATHDKDTLSPMTEPGAHDMNACATGQHPRRTHDKAGARTG